jgi:hypothetical protein
VVLLELRTEEFGRALRSEALPFVQGLLRQRGWDVRWWVLGVPPEAMHAGGRFVVDVPAGRWGAFQSALEAWRPTAAVLNHPLVGPLQEALRAQVGVLATLPPVAGLGVTLGEALAWVGESPAAHEAADALLVDLAHPVYQQVKLDGADPGEGPQPARLLSRARCVYQAGLERNPFYAGVADLPEVAGYKGCAFCRAVGGAEREPCLPFDELTLRQVEAHQRAFPAHPGPFEYVCEDAALPLALDRFAAALVARALKPCTFFLMMRADSILACAPRLEAALEVLRGAGHRLRLVSIGLENFSAVENLRLNKGLTAEQIWACHALLQDLEGRFPDTFGVPDLGYFSPIFFTPWTTPADLRINLENSKKLGKSWLVRALGSRLQLREGTPITALARHDGLAGDGFGSAGDIVPTCLPVPGDVEVPWRFAEPAVDRVHAILTRLDPLPWTVRYPSDDALLAQIRGLRQAMPDEADLPHLELCLGVLDAVVALGPEAPLEAVFRHVLQAFLAAHPEGDDRGFSFRRARRAVLVLQQAARQVARRPGGLRTLSLAMERRGGDYYVRGRFDAGHGKFQLEVGPAANGDVGARVDIQWWAEDRGLEPGEERVARTLAEALHSHLQAGGEAEQHQERLPTAFDGLKLYHAMGLDREPFLVDLNMTTAVPWSWRRDHLSAREMAGLWERHLAEGPLSPDFPLAFYLNVPFCTHTCSFCRCLRVEVGGDRRGMEPYTQLVLDQMDFYAPVFAGYPVGYFSIGGGTPSVLSADQMARVLERLHQRFRVQGNPINTCEVSLPTLRDDLLDVLVRFGIRRVSAGVQTLTPRIRKANRMFGLPLKLLAGRVEAMRARGIRCNLDLVVGLPGETSGEFLEGLRTLVGLAPDSLVVSVLSTWRQAVPGAPGGAGCGPTGGDGGQAQESVEDFLARVADGTRDIAAQGGYALHPHANNGESLFLSAPGFEEVRRANAGAFTRLACGVNSVAYGTSVFAFGDLCNLALVPNLLFGRLNRGQPFDADAPVYECTRREVYDMLDPEEPTDAPSFSTADLATLRELQARLQRAPLPMDVQISNRELLLEIPDPEQYRQLSRVFVRPSDPGSTFVHVGRFDLAYNDRLTDLVRRVMASVAAFLRTVG